ncbi:MAG: flagellar basal body P-ring formation chaperone FlgA [Pseudohongiellaceae bacterium]
MNVTVLTAKTCATAKTALCTIQNFYLARLRLAGLCAAFFLCMLPTSHGAEVETLESIRLSAEAHALAQIDHRRFENASATANPLDSRLQLKKCNTPLETFSRGAMNTTSRLTVGVRCTGLNPWTLYVPVTISALVDVVFSRRTLTRGALLTEADLQIKQLALNELPIGYLSDPSQIANFELRRPINADTAIILSAVKPRNIVQQGQEVIIKAELAGLQVRMAGEALKSGKSGDLIPVRNLRSGRTVEATVIAESTVSVNL